MRYGRITGSTAFNVSRCRTSGGTLVATILGGKTFETKAMKRGRDLESDVRKKAVKLIGVNFKECGLFISQKHIMLAASPDGISKDAVLEIKCPASQKVMSTYVKNNEVTKRYQAQIQLQMYVTGRENCYFCIADPAFEENKTVNIYLISYDENYVINLLPQLVNFWKENIFPVL